MSKKYKVPVVLKRGFSYGIIMEIIFAKDNSIYFSFPRKNKRSVQRELTFSYSKFNYSRKRMRANEFKVDNQDPKISFHPREMIVHANSNITGGISTSEKILNVGLDSLVNCYLLQINIPDSIDEYDEYHDFFKDRLEIDFTPIFDHVCIEIVIHSKILDISPSCLPEIKSRVYRFKQTFYDSNCKYACTVFVSTLTGRVEKNITITLNTEKNCYIYTID